jgi:hypothetical protein
MTDTPISSPAPVKRTWMPTTAGILSIIAGAFQLLAGLVIATIGAAFMSNMGMGRFGGVGAAFGILVIIIGIVSLLGGIFSLQRKLWGLALAGAICSLFLGWFAIFGVLAIVFVSLSKKEFV